MIRTTYPLPTASSRRQAGFTLVETLISGVLGAMLLGAVAMASFEFALGVNHLETKAGINSDEDTAMRQLTRDIREAWYAQQVSTSHIQLANPDENFIEYYYEDSQLKLRRPNGDVGTVAWDVTSVTFAPSYITRYREGTTSSHFGAWYEREKHGFDTNLTVESGDALALAFVVPYHDEDLPGVSGDDEHLSSAQLDVLSIPIAFIPGTNPESAVVEVFATRGPGSAEPVGDALGSVTIDGATLPQAVWDSGDGDWEEVDDDTYPLLDLSTLAAELTPGDSYTLRLSPTGDAELLVLIHPGAKSSDDDDVSYQTAGGSYVELPLDVAMTLSGDYDLSTTVEHEVIASFTVTLDLEGKPTQTRSASLLSQALSDDPWFGVVPGDTPP